MRKDEIIRLTFKRPVVVVSLLTFIHDPLTTTSKL